MSASPDMAALLAALQGAGGGAGGEMPMSAPPDMGAPPPEMGAPPEAGDQGDTGEDLSPEDHLRAAIDHAQAALVGEPDDQDSAQLAKLVQGLYAILSDRQKMQDKALGGTPDQMRVLRRGAAA